MIRTGQQYLESIRDDRQVYINGEREGRMFNGIRDCRRQ